MKFAAFDLEIAEPMENEYAGQHISCAAIFTDQGVKYHQNFPYMTPFDAGFLLGNLLELESQGYSILTWNGLSFDFRVLAEQSDRLFECKRMAMEHYDLMFQVLCVKGFPLGLNKAAIGAGLEGKKHEVVLKSGEVLTKMDGARAPELWQKGEGHAVLEYLHDDVEQLWKLATVIETKKSISWIANSGKFNSFIVPELLTVRDCLSLPLPDTSWMSTHITRESMMEWMKEKV